ncbi:hypothetical protein GL177_17825 [Vibrio toranzoniae]|uniref:hypothetical protein n=1 Tax=Vibrio TaxID=662 RepID=UPI0013781660|nr:MULTISPECIES: hypothetical protein [Vibrio]MDA0143734.1 hypothetical protein [Vibrio sp. RW]NAZ55183.1 hypothetical protein [Vibrio toranzoniae]NAZ92254.1 hypothetical protein [Vibrio toranzoniae]
MRTITKTLAAVAVMTISLGVYAHMGNNNGQFGFHHPMMDNNNPQYQAMLELQKNPEAMQQWMQQMRENPEAMQQWMEQMHGKNVVNRRGGFGCHGNRFSSNDNAE